MPVNAETTQYNQSQDEQDCQICELLAAEISTHLQWDYKNIVQRKGRLERLQ